MRVLKIDCGDMTYRLTGYLFRTYLRVKSKSRQDYQFCASVQAVDVLRRIGSRKAGRFGLFQRLAERCTCRFNPGKNEVTRPIQNPAQLEEPVAAQSLMQSGQHRDATSHTCPEGELLLMRPGHVH